MRELWLMRVICEYERPALQHWTRFRKRHHSLTLASYSRGHRSPGGVSSLHLYCSTLIYRRRVVNNAPEISLFTSLIRWKADSLLAGRTVAVQKAGAKPPIASSRRPPIDASTRSMSRQTLNNDLSYMRESWEMVFVSKGTRRSKLNKSKAALCGISTCRQYNLRATLGFKVECFNGLSRQRLN